MLLRPSTLHHRADVLLSSFPLATAW